MQDSDHPFVSVIIPVFNDAERLKICLDALDRQSYPKGKYQIIVIDNGSDHPEKVKAVVEPYSHVILTCESIPGSYVARNKGLSLATGEVIAFTDADCIPAIDWMVKGVSYLRQTPNCGQVVGKVDLCFTIPNQPSAVELYDSLTALRQEQLLRELRGGATANVFTWQKVIDQVGSFNTRLKSAGDMEWGERIHKAGYEQIYAADVIVKHPARNSFQAIYRRALRVAGGSYDWLIKPEHSFIQRQKMFARLVFNKLLQPIEFTVKTFTGFEVEGVKIKINGFEQKLQLSVYSFLLRYGGILELFRRKFGGISRRE